MAIEQQRTNETSTYHPGEMLREDFLPSLVLTAVVNRQWTLMFVMIFVSNANQPL